MLLQPEIVCVGPRPNDFLCFSICMLFCNAPFGLIALIFSCTHLLIIMLTNFTHANATSSVLGLSVAASDQSQFESARKWGRTSLGVNIVGIIIFVLLVIVIPVLRAKHASDDDDDGVRVQVQTHRFCDGELCSSVESCCQSSFSGSYYCC